MADACAEDVRYSIGTEVYASGATFLACSFAVMSGVANYAIRQLKLCRCCAVSPDGASHGSVCSVLLTLCTPAQPLPLLQFLSMFLVPETSKVPLEDITELWLHHKLWSKLVKPKKQPQPAAQRSAAASSASQQLGTAFRAAAAAVRHPGVGVFERQHGSLQLEQTLSGGAVDKLAAELQQHSGHRL